MCQVGTILAEDFTLLVIETFVDCRQWVQATGPPLNIQDILSLYEICHLVEHSQSERFYRFIPKLGITKERLNGIAGLIIVP